MVKMLSWLRHWKRGSKGTVPHATGLFGGGQANEIVVFPMLYNTWKGFVVGGGGGEEGRTTRKYVYIVHIFAFKILRRTIYIYIYNYTYIYTYFRHRYTVLCIKCVFFSAFFSFVLFCKERASEK